MSTAGRANLQGQASVMSIITVDRGPRTGKNISRLAGKDPPPKRSLRTYSTFSNRSYKEGRQNENATDPSRNDRRTGIVCLLDSVRHACSIAPLICHVRPDEDRDVNRSDHTLRRPGQPR